MQQMDGRKTCTYSSLAGPQKTTRQVTGDDLHAKKPSGSLSSYPGRVDAESHSSKGVDV